MRANRATRRIRILSAGCASGDEAFSIAILLRERAAELAGWNVELLGADVNERALTRAREGRFSRWALRETPPELRERWFAQDGAERVLDPSSRGAVRFERRNLCSDAAWPPEAAYDAIFFRNVLMYFTQAADRAVVAKVVPSRAGRLPLPGPRRDAARAPTKGSRVRAAHPRRCPTDGGADRRSRRSRRSGAPS